jgi:hypothetical protein
LTFGIRPSHLEDVALIPSESQTGSTLDGRVDVVENLGDELLVYLTVAGRSAVAKLDPRSQVKAGAQVRLHVDNEYMHLFDTASGEAIFWEKRQEHPGALRKENRDIWHNNVATSTRYVRSRRAPMDVRTV